MRLKIGRAFDRVAGAIEHMGGKKHQRIQGLVLGAGGNVAHNGKIFKIGLDLCRAQPFCRC